MGQGYDVAVVGGGIVGLATAHALLAKRPALRLAVLEKEAQLGQHQSGHNSGVIHSGIYYRPGSLKAKLCVAGAQRMAAFCEAHGIRWERPGKLIVATEPRELPALEELQRRAAANGVPGVRRLGPKELRDIEPEVRGIAGLHAPSTGIADYPGVVRALAAQVMGAGGEVLTGQAVRRIHGRAEGLTLETGERAVQARLLVNCAGLHADRVARLAGAQPDVQIVPFRGEYYRVRPERCHLVRALVYPVPDPAFPFLGVHFTRTVDGGLEAGPNAVLAFAREGYGWQRVHLGELWETVRFPGLWRLARRYWRTAAYEYWRSLSKAAFVRSLQRLLPAIRAEDLSPGGSGVRAQAMTAAGALVDDFRILASERAVHVLNAPSPAATASLLIGEHIAELALQRLR